jgi:hypothetical protein
VVATRSDGPYTPAVKGMVGRPQLAHFGLTRVDPDYGSGTWTLLRIVVTTRLVASMPASKSMNW